MMHIITWKQKREGTNPKWDNKLALVNTDTLDEAQTKMMAYNASKILSTTDYQAFEFEPALIVAKLKLVPMDEETELIEEGIADVEAGNVQVELDENSDEVVTVVTKKVLAENTEIPQLDQTNHMEEE